MYEIHTLTPECPITFQPYTLNKWQGFIPHWHENIEILHFTKNQAKCTLDSEEFSVKTDDTIVVNSNTIHNIIPERNDVTYHCLIISVDFLRLMGIDYSDISIKPIVNDNDIKLLFSKLNCLYIDNPPYYMQLTCAYALEIAAILASKYGTLGESSQNKSDTKFQTVKRVIAYMKKNYADDLSIDMLSEKFGFSKYYFCHTFKETTGVSPIKMLNYIRCEEARKMLKSDKHGISEVAFACGFNNLSYFTKTYKSIIGILPSETGK
jgi:AraC-like DNA-binding protein